MPATLKVRTYCCLKCGTPFEIHPPDDLHRKASRIEKECDQSVKAEYKCEKCGHNNTIFWCRIRRHPEWYA